jgi:uncharacterized membrane protein YphA (DoxX/SURF4 family)
VNTRNSTQVAIKSAHPNWQSIRTADPRLRSRELQIPDSVATCEGREHRVPSTLAFLVIAGELFSGIGLIVGLFSRIAALVIVLTMVGAIATVHLRFGLFLNWFGSQEGHGIEYHLLAIALALVVVVKGAGALSVDRLVYEHVSGWEQPAAGKKTMTAGQ